MRVVVKLGEAMEHCLGKRESTGGSMVGTPFVDGGVNLFSFGQLFAN